MEQKTTQALFALLRSAMSEMRLKEEEREAYSSDVIKTLLETSLKHDLIHLVVFGLKKNELIPKEKIEIENYIFKAFYRYEQLKYELDNLCAALKKAEIPFIPLKGSVLRKYYPEEWMRTSCDIDVLVHEEDCEKARAILTDEYGYVDHGKHSHDVSLFSPSNIHIELHYSLLEDGIANGASEVLKNVWSTAVLRDGYDFFYEMPDEMFYFYHIAHMVKHFEDGGCGIRSFIDLWILENIEDNNEEKRNALLEQGNLLRFADSARALSRVWFGCAEHDELTRQMENYILRGGVYGTNENRVPVQQQKQGGRFKYAISKIFLPYDLIKFHYPILQKHRWLTPFMEVRRWGRLIFCGHAKRTMKELKYNQSISNDEADETKNFLSSIGL